MTRFAPVLGWLLVSAASLGGVTTPHLASWSGPFTTPVPPTVEDLFTGTGNLPGKLPDTGPGAWVGVSGTWTYASGTVSQALAGANRRVVIPTGVAVQRVRVGLSGLPPTHTVGVVAKSNPTGNTYLRLEKRNVSGGQLRLVRTISGVNTVLATLNGVGNPTSGVLTLLVNGSSVTGWFGSSVLTFTLSPADTATFAPLTHAGLVTTGASPPTYVQPFRVWSF